MFFSLSFLLFVHNDDDGSLLILRAIKSGFISLRHVQLSGVDPAAGGDAETQQVARLHRALLPAAALAALPTIIGTLFHDWNLIS